MKLYDKLKEENIDLRLLGFEQREINITYYCTPKDAKILGWAGVDGIHYCTIPEFGEMIFAVNPMDFGDCVHPIAGNFEDLLRLLLSCADMEVLEQCYAWDEEQFKAFMMDCPATEEQQTVLERLKKTFNLEPIDDVFDYVKTLQAQFDLSQIPYTDDYYDPDMNAAAPERNEEWEVYFNGSFYKKGGSKERAGEEILINYSFTWGEEIWYVPAVYVCGEGLVIDCCVEISAEREKAFVEKWIPILSGEKQPTQRILEQLNRENPLNVGCHPFVTVNGKLIATECGTATSWIPTECLLDGTQNNRETKCVLTHYGLDETKAWTFLRWSCRWATRKKPKIKSVNLKLEREQTKIMGISFRNPKAGDQIQFIHPVFNSQHKMTILEYEHQELSSEAFSNDEYEYPTYHTTMTFSLEPEISNKNFQIKDCIQSDKPKRRTKRDFEPQTSCDGSAIGIIGGADGSIVFIVSDRKSGTRAAPHVALSALHFQPQPDVEWEMVFCEKLMPDIEVCLL